MSAKDKEETIVKRGRGRPKKDHLILNMDKDKVQVLKSAVVQFEDGSGTKDKLQAIKSIVNEQPKEDSLIKDVEEKNPIELNGEELWKKLSATPIAQFKPFFTEVFQTYKTVMVVVPKGLSTEAICKVSEHFKWRLCRYHEDGSWQFIPHNLLRNNALIIRNRDGSKELMDYCKEYLPDIRLKFIYTDVKETINVEIHPEH